MNAQLIERITFHLLEIIGADDTLSILNDIRSPKDYIRCQLVEVEMPKIIGCKGPYGQVMEV